MSHFELVVIVVKIVELEKGKKNPQNNISTIKKKEVRRRKNNASWKTINKIARRGKAINVATKIDLYLLSILNPSVSAVK